MRGHIVQIDDNGHKWQRLTGIRNGKLELVSLNLSDVPDGLLYEHYKTHRGDISHALHQVKAGKLRTLIQPTHRRDDPSVSAQDFAKECIAKGAPDLSSQLLLIPEKAPKPVKGCVALITVDRVPVASEKQEDGTILIRFRRGKVVLKRDEKTWVATHHDTVKSGTRAELERWAKGHLLQDVYKSLTWEDDKVSLEWSGNGPFECRAGSVRLKVEQKGKEWHWDVSGKKSGIEASKRKAMRAAAVALGAV